MLGKLMSGAKRMMNSGGAGGARRGTGTAPRTTGTATRTTGTTRPGTTRSGGGGMAGRLMSAAKGFMRGR